MSSSSLSEADRYWESVSTSRLVSLRTDLAYSSIQHDGLLSSQIASRRAALESERLAVKRVLSKIDASLNDLQPVNSLPSDILTHIFLLVVDNFSQSGGRPSLLSHPRWSPPWLNLVRVCKRWRDEALACPSLWCRLSTSMKPRLLSEFIKRSQDASLSLTTDWYRWRGTSDHLDVVFTPEVLDRTKEMTVVFAGLGQDPRIYLSKLARSMPRLESFSYRHETLSRAPASATVQLPSNLFDGSAPRLRQLILETPLDLPQRSHVFNNLRTFCLNTSRQPSSNYAPPLPTRLFDFIEAMPHLERLELKHTLPIVPFTLHHVAPLSRPRLKTVALAGPITSCAAVMRWFHLSPSCEVAIDSDASTSTSVDDFADLLDALAVAGIKDVTPRFLSATSESQGNLHLAAFQNKTDLPLIRDGPLGAALSHPGLVPLFRLSTTGLKVNDNSVMPAHISAICKRFLSLERLEVFNIYIDMDERRVTGGPTASNELHDLWHSVLGPCPRLREVRCTGAPAYVLLRELSTHEPRLILPALETLCFDDDFISRDLLYEGKPIYDLLLNALQHRSIRQTQICETQPFIDEAALTALQEFTTLKRFPRRYVSYEPPEHFFEFGPDWAPETFVISDDEMEDEMFVVEDEEEGAQAFEEVAAAMMQL